MTEQNKAQTIEEQLRAEIARQQKVIQVLMDRVEDSSAADSSDFNLFQNTVMLEEQVRQRTRELEHVLRENEKITRALRESETNFHRLVEHTLVGIVVSDDTRFHYVNPKFSEITGYSEDELLSMGPVHITPKSKGEDISGIFRCSLNGNGGDIELVAQILCKGGELKHVQLAGSSPTTWHGKKVLLIAFSDISERVRAEQEINMLNQRLREQAVRDPLTGLFNRRYMEETLEGGLAHAHRYDQSVCVVMGDLDYFKQINDTYGHQAGDEVLRTFGQLIQSHARASDICCRYGGEEFLVVLFNIDEHMALKRIEGLRRSIGKQLIHVRNLELQVTASFGLAVFPKHGDDVRHLIEAADAALYQAKAAGRNRVLLADDIGG